MIYYLKYDIQSICKRLAQEQLKDLVLDYSMINGNEVDINQPLSDEQLNIINITLSNAGVEIVASQKSILVQKIKEAVNEIVQQEDQLVLSKTSCHLAKTLGYSYRYLSAVFSEVTFTTIENYIILQKIERAKKLIGVGELSFTEIAWKLNYSSIGHFSMQFKNTTGFTPTLFKKIINQKRNNVI